MLTYKMVHSSAHGCVDSGRQCAWPPVKVGGGYPTVAPLPSLSRNLYALGDSSDSIDSEPDSILIDSDSEDMMNVGGRRPSPPATVAPAILVAWSWRAFFSRFVFTIPTRPPLSHAAGTHTDDNRGSRWWIVV